MPRIPDQSTSCAAGRRVKDGAKCETQDKVLAVAVVSDGALYTSTCKLGVHWGAGGTNCPCKRSTSDSSSAATNLFIYLNCTLPNAIVFVRGCAGAERSQTAGK